MITSKRQYLVLIILPFIFFSACSPKQIVHEDEMDVQAILKRHEVHNNEFDTLASLSVGNGKFAMTVDATGLQTFPDYYAGGVPLGMQSEWGWHKFPNLQNYTLAETFEMVETSKGKVSYAVSGQQEKRARAASDFLRSNPHRIHLASLGLVLDKQAFLMSEISKIDQSLDLYTGTITSIFELKGEKVTITTICNQQEDGILVSMKSNLVKAGRLQLLLRYPDPLGEWKDVAVSFDGYEGERISVRESDGIVSLNRRLDDFSYHTKLVGNKPLSFQKTEDNHFLIFPTTNDADLLEVSMKFAPTSASNDVNLAFDQIKTDNKKTFEDFWAKAAMIDAQGSTDPAATELERRYVLSKYLVHIQSGGAYPPQETGLTYNSWYGRPHLEMFYWHILGQALTGEEDRLFQQLNWYKNILPEAQKLAKRQGYKGARWLKMTDPSGEEGPSNVGAYLIWQQPHVIHLADLLYDIKKDPAVLNAFSEIVFESAEFMADFATYVPEKKSYILGPPLIGAQERFNAKSTYSTSYEVAYWKQTFRTAITWKKLLKEEIPAKWLEVEAGIPNISIIDGKYTMAESAADSYTNERYRTDHPMILGVAGLTDYKYDKAIMMETYNWIKNNWSWEQTWGWDYPMVAMCATDLGMPEEAIAALLLDVQKNTYLKNGHNFQDDRLTIYLPGNAAYIAAIAKMASTQDGFPKGDSWKIKAKGFLKNTVDK